MQFLPVALHAHRGNWQRFQSRKRNKRFLEIQKKIFARDKNTCRFCGFQSDKYQVVVNRDQDYGNNKSANLVTACSLCAQCFFIDSVGKDGRTGGHIIYLPEITQADLNHFCRVLFSSLLKDAAYKGKLQTSYLSLKDRTQAVEELFGPGSSNPQTFGQSLLDSELNKEQLKHPALLNLRLLPERKYFAEEIIYWKRNIFDQIPL